MSFGVLVLVVFEFCEKIIRGCIYIGFSFLFLWSLWSKYRGFCKRKLIGIYGLGYLVLRFLYF